MKYANIKKHDIANGPGIRVSLFVSGCNHHCKVGYVALDAPHRMAPKPFGLSDLHTVLSSDTDTLPEQWNHSQLHLPD